MSFSELGLGPSIDLSSSDESYQRPNRPHVRSGRLKVRGPSIRDGPETLAKLRGERKGGRQGTVLPNNGENYATDTHSIVGNLSNVDTCHQSLGCPLYTGLTVRTI